MEDDLTPDLFNQIRKYIYDHARISLGDNKMELVRSRFGKMIRQRKMGGFHEYFKWMKTDTSGEALREAMNAIATNLTSFFRENDHFIYLAKTLIPEIEARGPSSGGKIRLRAWSAGCSTGEEVYTIAMTLCENITKPEMWDIKLLATDLDTEVVAHGQRGVYSTERVQGVQTGIVNKYFDKTTDERGKPAFRIKEPLRRMVTFRHLNLFSDWPFRNQFDFIFCRNVMIYFDRPTQEGLINKYYSVLAKNGRLFIGHSESLSGVNHQFEYVKPTIYLKK